MKSCYDILWNILMNCSSMFLWKAAVVFLSFKHRLPFKAMKLFFYFLSFMFFWRCWLISSFYSSVFFFCYCCVNGSNEGKILFHIYIFLLDRNVMCWKVFFTWNCHLDVGIAKRVSRSHSSKMIESESVSSISSYWMLNVPPCFKFLQKKKYLIVRRSKSQFSYPEWLIFIAISKTKQKHQIQISYLNYVCWKHQPMISVFVAPHGFFKPHKTHSDVKEIKSSPSTFISFSCLTWTLHTLPKKISFLMLFFCDCIPKPAYKYIISSLENTTLMSLKLILCASLNCILLLL